ncbi:peptidase inhibitor family I36 protein [Actinomyces bowdenii]|uniref:peptidase inhibitor family I36 protein n=1 Tax=Actinomyces bowdenii TaxID=131109 RepID=UPI00214CDCB7|nr:peptidase inhibitor family I36 protein [Actinomyces bowdenii]MCR2053794.1 peptidase inhibitor family I36 protein [Actinomyces bowdenii]
MKNNAASVTNRTNYLVIVYYNSNYGGRSQVIPAGASADLDSGLKNENASHYLDIPKPCVGVCPV